MEGKLTKEQILDAIIGFENVMNYIYNERLYWYEQRGNMDKALSDIHHAIENEYDESKGQMYAKLIQATTKERRKYKDMQELFLPVYNAYKDCFKLSHAIREMKNYNSMIKQGRKYEPKVLHELFEEV